MCFLITCLQKAFSNRLVSVNIVRPAFTRVVRNRGLKVMSIVR